MKIVRSVLFFFCLRSHMDANQDLYVKRLADACAIQSVSSWPHTRQDITTMVKWTESFLVSLGAQVQLHDVGMEVTWTFNSSIRSFQP
jgi:hypothetical protein